MNTRSWLSLLSPLIVLIGACASGPRDDGSPGDIDDAARAGASIQVDNPTRDTWDLEVGGAPRGSVAPGSQTTLFGIPGGRRTVVALNERLGLRQEVVVDADPRHPAHVVLESMVTRLRVHNPHPEAVVIAIDGTTIGSAPAAGETVFEGVPAGRRMVLIKSATGPGAVRLERTLPTDGEARLTIPDLAAEVIDLTAPRPPEGKGLVRMKNASQLLVVLYVDGLDRGVVPPGGTHDLVLEPGTHDLEVRLRGIEAKTQHRVTLLPNQVAEWTWDEGVQPTP